MSNMIEVKNLSFAYAQKSVLEDLSFGVDCGTFFAIAGPNGAGKTTLINLLCGLIPPGKGSVKIDSADVKSYTEKKMARKIAVVRQEFIPAFDFTVAETVMMARTPYIGRLGFESSEDRDIVNQSLEITGTSQFARRSLASLSGGERQLVFIARAIAQDTPVLLLDEPTSALDIKHQVGIYDLLKKMQLEKGKTIAAVTHDINLTIQYCDSALLLGRDGSYLMGETKDVFSPEQIENVFGVKTFTGRIGQENFFIPIGSLAKDAAIITGKVCKQ